MALAPKRVAQSTWLDEYSRRFAGWPDFADWAPLRALPERTRNALARRLVPFGYAMWARGLNRVGRRYGLPRLAGSRMFEGDHTLFAEPEGFSEVGIPARLAGRAAFIGPLLGALDLPVPEEIEHIAIGAPLPLAKQPFRVIAPVANLLEGGPPAPPNVVVTGWIPAEKVNPLAQVSVLHGGIGTLLTACQAGTPIVGIPNGNPEQEWNLGALVRKGFAVHLHKNRLTPATIVDAVKRLLADTEAQRRARDFASVCRSWNGPENAAAYLEKHLAPRL